jgi:hypothetical protein
VTAPIDAPARADEPDGGRRRGWSTKVQVVVLVANIAFWAAILGWTLMSGEVEPPDRLDQRAFPTAAEPRCADARDDIDALGLPTDVETPEERADMVDEENGILTAMVDDLEALDRPTGEEGEWVGQWLADWRTHIQDRQDWADDLRAGDDHAFVETDRGGEQVSNVIDNFAEVNEMESCATPGDV